MIIIFPHITAATCVGWSVPSVARSRGWLEEAKVGLGRGGENREMMMKSILDIPRGPLEIQTNLREQFTITAPTYSPPFRIYKDSRKTLC